MTDGQAFPEAWIRRLHEAPPRLVLRFAGAGVQALAWLHAVAGSSRTLLEATDIYHPASMIDALGYEPARSVDAAVARDLARSARARADRLVELDADPGPRFGLAATATIATDRPKRGEHRVEVASADGFGVARYGTVLRKGARDRAGEEAWVSRLLLAAAADACGLLDVRPPASGEGETLTTELTPEPSVASFLEGAPAGRLAIDPAGLPGATPPPVLVSGSFHPLHEGHLRLAEAAAAHLGAEVGFELPLRNAAKEPLEPWEARRRAAQFKGRAPLVLTHAPRFVDKVEALPGTTFVVGADTAERILQPRYYGGEAERDAALARVRAAGGAFLVAGRAGPGSRYRTLDDLPVPPAAAELFMALPDFRVDLSSTEIRARWAASNS